MCGLARHRRPRRPGRRRRGRRGMADALAHRGPDDDGLFATRARRSASGGSRSSTSPRGHQPMADARRPLRIVHNGEIYNYRELRDELEARGHRFRSADRHRGVLAAYREWGERCVERFNGMWAFAIWDAARAAALLLARPLRRQAALLPARRRAARVRERAEGVPRRRAALAPNVRVVRDFLEQGCSTTATRRSSTASPAAAGALARLRRATGCASRATGSSSRDDAPPADPAAAVARAVPRRRPAAACAATSRSGPASPAGSTRRRSPAPSTCSAPRPRAHAGRPRQQMFTAYFERRRLRRAAVRRGRRRAQTGAEPHWSRSTARDLVETCPRSSRRRASRSARRASPRSGSSCARRSEAGLKVMLDGQGGDEIFAGYHALRLPFSPTSCCAARSCDARAELRALRGAHGREPRLVVADLARRLRRERVVHAGAGRDSGARDLRRRRASRGAELRRSSGRAFRVDRLRRPAPTRSARAARGLPELLRYEDRNSMAHSIEARVPFLDYRLVELVFSLDGDAPDRARARRRRSCGARSRDLLPPAVARPHATSSAS